MADDCNIVISNFEQTNVITVDGCVEIMTVGEQGPPGAAGSDKNLVFNQAIPAAVWTINHNLNKFPSVTVIDSSGRVVEGDVQYQDVDNLTIAFSSAFSGDASLN